ncbi:GNAT family N-acetyltransferase [Weissella fangxianensis]|uniref:GNAT family N-acetyltransferase n=1 Tax=Weissella fangxianensis TaxID=2953879 RepID=UPI0021575873|nr:GNAT family N-acetyltransferase [Weissella fangxianensis]
MAEVTLTIKNNNELTSSELITIMQARTKVFVVEQNCAYQEVDDADFNARHVCLTNDHDLVAYTRIISDDDPNYIRFGRVLVATSYRHQQFGRQIVTETIKEIRRLYPEKDIKIGAQNYLRNFYESFGFQAVSDVYLEDDIPHIDMLLSEDH